MKRYNGIFPYKEVGTIYNGCFSVSYAKVLCNSNGSIPHLQTEIGNSSLTFAELLLHYSLNKIKVKLNIQMKDCK